MRESIGGRPGDSDSQPVPAELEHAAPLRILVADDYEDSREMLAFLLESLGHTVALAADGRSALMVAQEFQPDVAILDIGMPGLSGYGVAQELRRERGAGLVLLALSGHGLDSDKARSLDAGFDQHFTKPVDISVLSSYLGNLRKP